jgi:hypothetical protein
MSNPSTPIKFSSDFPTITIAGKSREGTEMPRKQFWAKTIQGEIAKIPTSETPVYIATGGGYGSFDTLIDHLKSTGEIDSAIPSIKGDMYRELSPIKAEAEGIKKARKSVLSDEKLHANPDGVEQAVTGFYSDEVNTKIAKEVVKGAIRAKKSSIHESASIYDDTIERAKLAKEHGLKTVLIAGDKNLDTAIETLKHIEPANTARSYQKFSERFGKELVNLFDEIQLYNTDQSPPVLIAQKKGVGQELEVLNEELYGQFTAKRHLKPDLYASPTVKENPIHLDWQGKEGKGKEPGTPG